MDQVPQEEQAVAPLRLELDVPVVRVLPEQAPVVPVQATPLVPAPVADAARGAASAAVRPR